MKLKIVTNEEIHKKHLKGFKVETCIERLGYIVSKDGWAFYLDPFHVDEKALLPTGKFKRSRLWSDEFDQYVSVKLPITKLRRITQKEYDVDLKDYLAALENAKNSLMKRAKLIVKNK